MVKKIIIAQVIFTVFAGMFLFSLEAGAQYTLMEPLPGLEGKQRVSSYVPVLIKAGIVLAALLAVVMIVIAGFMYITAAGNTGTIEKAKTYLLDAIIGLLIAVGYFLVLQAINPDILKSNIGALEGAEGGQVYTKEGGGTTGAVGGGGGEPPAGETSIYIPEGEPNTDPSSVPWSSADTDWRGADEEEGEEPWSFDPSEGDWDWLPIPEESEEVSVGIPEWARTCVTSSDCNVDPYGAGAGNTYSCVEGVCINNDTFLD